MRTRLALLMVLGACGPGDDTPSGECDGILAGELVVTEIFADHAPSEGGSGADEGKEWFEVYNATGAPIDLEGVTITLARPDGTSDHVHVMESVTIEAGDYLVLGNVLPEFVDGHLDYGYADSLGEMFNTNGGRISLRCGDEVVDEALFDVIEPGQSTGFDGGAAPDYTANDDLALWCVTPDEAAFAFEPDNFGTPGSENVDCVGGTPGMCDDGGTMRPTVAPLAGDLVITEVHPNPSGDDELQEWFEAYAINGGFDLNGVALDREGDSDVIAADACLEVAAGTYLVFGKTAEAAMNGGLPRVDGIFGFSLVDSGSVGILDPAGAPLDVATWTNAGADRTRQVDPDFMEPGANDDETVWCDATVAWAGADLGSPGAMNEQCPVVVPPGMCLDNGTPRAIVPPTLGQLVITEVHANPSGTEQQDREWFEVRATAAVDLNGSKLDRATDSANPVPILATDCLHLEPGEYALFAGSAVTADNGGLPTVDAVFSFTLVNTAAGEVRVLDPADLVVDAVTWSAIQDGIARQLDPDITDATMNDVLTNWCNATTTYNGGTDLGTPRAVNDVQCP